MEKKKNNNDDKAIDVNIEPLPDNPDGINSLLKDDSPPTLSEPKSKKAKIEKDKLLDQIEKKQTRKVGRPTIDSKLWNEDMVEPLIQQFSATIGRILGDKWALESKEIKAWAMVSVPLLNKYASETSHAPEWNALLMLSTYLTSRIFGKQSAGGDA
ncbi:MAG: hypothetical protein ACE5IR_11830 [bacterium]